MDERSRSTRERVREAIKASNVPMPAEVVRKIAQLSSQDARDVLRGHPGFPVWERRMSYETSLQIFEQSVQDLLRAIEDFKDLSLDGSIFDRTREGELNQVLCSVQKELFAAGNAVHALMYHSTRRLQRRVQVPGYDQRLTDCFGDDGLHDFVIGLRNIVQHIQMVRPGWQVTHAFGEAQDVATFKLDRDELLLIVKSTKDKMNASGKRYLESAPEKIDLRHVFEEYRQRAREFYSWFSDAIDAHRLEELRDYERCRRENNNAAARMSWKAVLGIWLNRETPPNPYNHLARYLTADQLEEVYALPMRSNEQVDKVIEFVDTDGACDDELRKLAYQLFCRASADNTFH